MNSNFQNENQTSIKLARAKIHSIYKRTNNIIQNELLLVVLST